MMLEETAVYQSLPDNKIKLVLGIGEHLKVQCVKSMFDAIRTQRGLYDFAPENSLPRLYTVTFKNASCGYFLKGNAYKVWATPVGIPDQQTGEIVKGWIAAEGPLVSVGHSGPPVVGRNVLTHGSSPLSPHPMRKGRGVRRAG